MEGSNAVVETRRQKAVCLMLVPKDERRMYLAWIFDPHLEINVINMSCMDIHEPFQQERLREEYPLSSREEEGWVVAAPAAPEPTLSPLSLPWCWPGQKRDERGGHVVMKTS